MKLRIGDNVKVNTGSNKGKTGKIQKVVEDKRKVVVEGINVYKKHNRKNMGEGIVEKTFPLDVSKVSLVCPKCNQTARIGLTIGSDGKKIRTCRKCKQPLN